MKNLLVDSNIKAVKRRLNVTLDNIKHQKGKAFSDDIEKIEHCILALENNELEKWEKIIDFDGSIQYVAKY
tara:strand:- start:458 stop:670 length:213 start_codon:yes stop_codon:yes gene_type:complete